MGRVSSVTRRELTLTSTGFLVSRGQQGRRGGYERLRTAQGCVTVKPMNYKDNVNMVSVSKGVSLIGF